MRSGPRQLPMYPVGVGYRGLSSELYRSKSPRSVHNHNQTLTKTQNNFLNKLNRKLSNMLVPHGHISKTMDQASYRRVSILESTPLSATMISTEFEVTKPLQGVIGRKTTETEPTYIIDNESFEEQPKGRHASKGNNSQRRKFKIVGSTTSNRSHTDEIFVLSSGHSEIRVTASPAQRLKTEKVAAYGLHSNVIRRVALDNI